MTDRQTVANEENENSPNRKINQSLMDSSPVQPVLKVVKQPCVSPPSNLTAAKNAVTPVQSPVQDDALVVHAEPDVVEDFIAPKRTPVAELVVLDGGGGGASSLQDSFKRFRKQKVKERKIMQMCKEDLQTKGPRTQEFRDNLRMKFIDQAKK
jgi:hypothetical protein